jgi:hypothetical protein
VHEDIFTGLTLDETITLGGIEPLHCALFLHRRIPLVRDAG